MTEIEMIHRTKRFALHVFPLIEALPRNRTGQIIAHQLRRSALSVGANYRAACRGRSKAEFYSKLGVVEEEADESLYWLELIVEGGLLSKNKVELLIKEASEIVAIIVASRKTISRGLATTPNRKSQIANRKS
ncbi:MAG TPA: four helix bundle protein [Tepidisphaeraceae bacterium]|nr:four helix bundle protein [Tepidisphaeraceae bacterium]